MTDALTRHKTVIPSASVEPVRPTSEPEQIRELLAFTIADETYALPLTAVREIFKSPAITEVPRAGRDVLGVISVRGRITTVVDLRRRLRMPESEVSRQHRVLLVDGGHEVIGLLVDRVLQVYRLTAEEVEMAAVVGGDTADYVMGVGRPKGGGRSLGRVRTEEDETVKDDILILLDPVPLLRI